MENVVMKDKNRKDMEAKGASIKKQNSLIPSKGAKKEIMPPQQLDVVTRAHAMLLC